MACRMEFKRLACVFAKFLRVSEPLPDPDEHVGLIAECYVCEFFRQWNKFLCGFGIMAKEFLADVTTSHPQESLLTLRLGN